MPLACACHPYSVLLPVGFTLPPALPQARCALAAPFHPYPAGARAPKPGGLLSVALSLGSPPPAVNRHRIPVEPGLSSSVAAGGRPVLKSMVSPPDRCTTNASPLQASAGRVA
jgi:hypothetical protein